MNKLKKSMLYLGITAISLLSVGIVSYLSVSYNFGTLNYKKWSEIREERYDYFKYFDIDKNKKISIDEFFEKYPKKLYKNHVPFNNYDLNKDKVIDSNEFVKVFPGIDNL